MAPQEPEAAPGGNSLEVPGSRPATQGGSRPRSPAPPPPEAGWVDCAKIDRFLSDPINVLACVDGSPQCMAAFKYVAQGLLQQEKDSYLECLHIFDDSKDYLVPAWKPDALKMACEAQLTASMSKKRYGLTWLPKPSQTQEEDGIGQIICKKVDELKIDFLVMGIYGRKGYSRERPFSSNTVRAMQDASASMIIMQTEDPETLPLRRPAKFVVATSLNAAATKAFVDALKLSKTGDEIHVVYIKSYLEKTDSDYTKALRKKYEAFFSGLEGGCSEVISSLSSFSDRVCLFRMIEKKLRETTSQAVARYAEEEDADFVVVGTNTLRLKRRGLGGSHRPIGSVSLQILMDTKKNVVCSNYTAQDKDLLGDSKM